MKRALIAAVMLFIVAPNIAAAPKATDEQECFTWGSFAGVAAAAARAGIERGKAETMLSQVYETPTEDGRAIARLILIAVYGLPKDVEAIQFAETLAETCMRNEGDMDSILGTGS